MISLSNEIGKVKTSLHCPEFGCDGILDEVTEGVIGVGHAITFLACPSCLEIFEGDKTSSQEVVNNATVA